MRDITDEIRKLKAIIVKHENRIRALEATVREQEDAADGVAARTNNTSNNDTKATESNSTNKEDANGSAATATASDDV